MDKTKAVCIFLRTAFLCFILNIVTQFEKLHPAVSIGFFVYVGDVLV